MRNKTRDIKLKQGHPKYNSKIGDIIPLSGSTTMYGEPQTFMFKVIAKLGAGEFTIEELSEAELKTERLLKVKNLKKNMSEAIFGQEKAIEEIESLLKMYAIGLNDDSKPLGSCLFSGPTGVGKTEVAKETSRLMGFKFVRFDMSEYMEAHEVSKLIGSPNGYVDSNRPGLLAENIPSDTPCVVLFDEIEKAHSKIYDLFLQMLDYGKVKNNKGVEIDFTQCLIVFTSNLGVHERNAKPIGINSQVDEKASIKAIEGHFRPELRNRLDKIIEFKALTESESTLIVKKYLSEWTEKMKDKSLFLNYSPQIIPYLARKGYDPLMGARPLKKVIQSEVVAKVSQKMIDEEKTHNLDVFVELVNGETKVELNQREDLVIPNQDAPEELDMSVEQYEALAADVLEKHGKEAEQEFRRRAQAAHGRE